MRVLEETAKDIVRLFSNKWNLSVLILLIAWIWIKLDLKAYTENGLGELNSIEFASLVTSMSFAIFIVAAIITKAKWFYTNFADFLILVILLTSLILDGLSKGDSLVLILISVLVCCVVFMTISLIFKKIKNNRVTTPSKTTTASTTKQSETIETIDNPATNEDSVDIK